MPQYEILEILGRGGMGVVYKAKDNVLRRTVAIKVFHENLVQQEVVIKRFIRESSISAQLDHPHIVKVYSFERQAGQSFLVMECIQGKPLLPYIEEKNLNLESQLEILVKIANALHYAHRKKIIHRDIKPSNIMIRSNGEPVVMDFGIAKCIGLDELTRTGEFVGTIQYVSPEQAEGNRRELDHRTDVYSLGAVMYHLLTGKPPVEATTSNEMLYQLAYHNPTSPQDINPNIPLAVEQICLKALAKDKTQRYASAQAFADDIQNYLSGKKTQALRWAKQQFWKRLLLRSSLVLGIVVLLAGIAFGSYTYIQKQQIADKKEVVAQKIQVIQTQIEKQNISRIDQLDIWKQTCQDAQEAYDLYQQNRQWIDDPQLAINLFNYRSQCTYQLATHQWVEDPLQSIPAFAAALDIPLPPKEQPAKTQIAVLGANMHLKYLSHNYQEVCESTASLLKYFKTTKDFFLEYPELALLVAKSHFHCQQYEHTQKYLKALTGISHFMSHDKIKAEVFYYQGMCYYYKMQYNDALQNFEDAEKAWLTYNKPVDFEIYLLVYLGDCRSKLLSYSALLTPEDILQLETLLTQLDQRISKLPQHAPERALYYELKARCLLCPVAGKDPGPEKIGQALESISKSEQILPCRYTQHLLRGMAFRYQGKTDFNQYHKAWQEFNDASELNPHQADSAAFILKLSTTYLHYSRDQVSDLILQLQRWNTRMESVATDFYQSQMRQLELQCNGQLQKFVGIPYEERLASKFYNDLQSPVSSIRQLARASLIDLVSNQEGQTTHQQADDYLEQKLQQINPADPFHQTLVAILKEIKIQESKEAAWKHLYFLVRIPYRGTIPDLVLAECNRRPGMTSFLVNMLNDMDSNMLPELKPSWQWLQYLAARVLVQLPYPLNAKDAATLAANDQIVYRYARQILYDMITSSTPKRSLSATFCLSVAKALKDARFLWWDRTLILKWCNEVWPQLKDNHNPNDMWQQTHVTSLLVSKIDEPSRNFLGSVYQETRYNLVKAWIVHELPKRERNFLPEVVMKDFYQWIPKQLNESSEVTQLRMLNILNTAAMCSYISGKYEGTNDDPKKKEDRDQEYRSLITQLGNLLGNPEEDIQIHKTVMTAVLITWDLSKEWRIANEKNASVVHSMSKLLKSTDQETRLLAIAAAPLMGNSLSLEELTREALNPNQPFVEKIALFYGIFNSASQSANLHAGEQKLQIVLKFITQLQDTNVLGWIFAIICHFRHYIEEEILDTQIRSFILTYISTKIMAYLNSNTHDLLFWTLISITRINDFSPTIYQKLGNMVKEKKLPSSMLEMLTIGVLTHLAMKNHLPDDVQQWAKLGYEKLKKPEFRPYLSIFIWCYLQIMRNNALNFQIRGDILSKEEVIAIQDFHWLRYQKSLLDPQLHHYAEICLPAALQFFEEFQDNLTTLEQKQLESVELMLATLYYHDGKKQQANQILEKNNKHLQQIPIAMLWSENNLQRIHEIWPTWNTKIQQYAQEPQQATMSQAAMFMRMTAIQHQQQKQQQQAIQDLQTAALLESREAKSWTLLAEAMMGTHPKEVNQILEEAHRSGFDPARTHWTKVRHSAKYETSSEARINSITGLLNNAGYWEYPITLPMLQDLGCNNIPTGFMCYDMACNHARNRWHYEACYWLKAAVQYNYELTQQQKKDDFRLFEKYTKPKYKSLEAQDTIKKLFGRK